MSIVLAERDAVEALIERRINEGQPTNFLTIWPNSRDCLEKWRFSIENRLPITLRGISEPRSKSSCREKVAIFCLKDGESQAFLPSLLDVETCKTAVLVRPTTAEEQEKISHGAAAIFLRPCYVAFDEVELISEGKPFFFSTTQSA